MTGRPRGMAPAVAALAIALAVVLPAHADSGPPPAYSMTKTIARAHLVDGHDDVVDSRTVGISVDQTAQLQGHQEVTVRWTGAHPTGGVVADQNSGDARNEEYPVVIAECRGADDPTSCWTATAGERFVASFDTAFPPWRVDRYATADQRQAVVGQPQPRPKECFGAAPSEYWVPFTAAGGVTYPGGPQGCAGQAPESANVGGLSLPSNTTYGVTKADGSGQAKFDIWTAAENASLGCSQSVTCSLVVIPIMGISCDTSSVPPDDADAANAACDSTGAYKPGQLSTPAVLPAVAVTGALWWAASNWRNRVIVPLTFAPSSNACDVVTSGSEIDLYGSELMSQAMLQWAPHFCLNSQLFRLKHVKTPEPEARNLLGAGNVAAVLTSDVPEPSAAAPAVNAPVALTGFAIAFSVDDAGGNPVAALRLTPRLLAKLLTESYPAINAMKDEDGALAANPLNMSLDPEFIALNPGITQGVAASPSASTLLALSTSSDVIHALTSYINADPDARAWLDGTPDPWGMVVNPAYKHIVLPTSTWQLLDTFEPPKLYASDTNDCLSHDPVPFLPLVAAPVASLATIAQDMQFSLANSTIVCKQIADGTSQGEKLVAEGRQTTGYRFMLGVTTLADAARYGLSTAALQTSVASSAAAKFTSPDGRTFVAPTDDSLRATAALLSPDPASQSWPIPYDALRTNAGAYPGTMIVYARIPTQGVPAADAGDLATFLEFAAGDGQHPGAGPGQLPPGYLPLTAANHLGDESTYTTAAASDVRAQDGKSPSVVPTTTTTVAPTTSTTVARAPTASTSTTSTTVAPQPRPAVAPPTTPPPPAALNPRPPAPPPPARTLRAQPVAAPTVSPVASAPRRIVVNPPASSRPSVLARTIGQASRLAGLALPFMVLLGACGLVVSATLNAWAGRRVAR